MERDDLSNALPDERLVETKAGINTLQVKSLWVTNLFVRHHNVVAIIPREDGYDLIVQME